jgi:hypothetical protein
MSQKEKNSGGIQVVGGSGKDQFKKLFKKVEQPRTQTGDMLNTTIELSRNARGN